MNDSDDKDLVFTALAALVVAAVLVVSLFSPKYSPVQTVQKVVQMAIGASSVTTANADHIVR